MYLEKSRFDRIDSFICKLYATGGIRCKSYSIVVVIEGVRTRARVFVGDSIVRKTDRGLNKWDDVVVCFPGAKIETITDRVGQMVGQRT